MDYEIIVKYVDHGSRVFNNYYHAPNTYESTKIPNSSTRLDEPHDRSEHRSINRPRDRKRHVQQRKVAYLCSDYRIENGVLVLSNSNKRGVIGPGTMIPLTSIEEITIDIARDDSKQIKEDYTTATDQVDARQVARRSV